ncbi:hypothetical protein QJS04_geneDACA011774 [Acorus gramineus]|uniref:Uncharacterized protein n=1 Tax=Acorus gramineus TaxID=55184 RepID=A0AAV9BJX0_ACOGR|nr:hypothetical protein QJS04_geneDACA011774 [Acorus gramineus]
MEGSGDDPGAPESWEMADLDETMGHLVVSSSSSNNKSSTSSPPSEDPFEEPPATAVVKASAGTDGGVSEDVVNQVDQFLREALQNPRERLSILRMEQDIEKFIRDPRQQQLEFQHFPTSYLRLAAHRVAQHYYLQSMVALDNSSPDGSGSRIVVYKTSECRLPPIRLADIPVNLPQEDSSSGIKLAIKPRPLRRSQAIGGAGTHSSTANHLKSVEERKEEYNRARARIFSGSGSIRGGSVNIGGPGAKSDSESALPDGFQPSSLVLMREEEKSYTEGSDSYISRVSSDSSSGSSRSNRSREEKDPVNRSRGSNKVAIFRDREVERKDPDYDRNYDRYMQRFDPGFGFNQGPYTIQPLYAPAVNYNTEFPQLGMNQRPHMSIDHHPRLVPQHMRGPWPGMSGPSAIGHGPPEASMPPFNPNPFGGHSSAVYVHSSQYAVAPRPGMAYVRPHDHAHQNFTQV